MIIYKATNLINGKVYIGQTVGKLKRRIYEHRYESRTNRKNLYFHNSIKKHGMSNFNFEIIDNAPTIEGLNEKESFWIDRHNSTDKKHGYNLRPGGTNSYNSPETRAKISKANKGKVRTKEHCRRISEGKKGWKWSDKIRKAVMDGRKNGKNRWSDKARAKHSESMRRENLPMETRRKISEANTGEGNGRATITEKTAIQIKQMLAAGHGNTYVSQQLSVSICIVKKINYGKIWRHIEI